MKSIKLLEMLEVAEVAGPEDEELTVLERGAMAVMTWRLIMTVNDGPSCHVLKR